LSSVKSWNEIPGARYSSETADGPVQSDEETYDSLCDDLTTNSNRGEWTGSTRWRASSGGPINTLVVVPGGAGDTVDPVMRRDCLLKLGAVSDVRRDIL